MVLLQNEASYTSPVLDPWFRATSHADLTGANLTNQSYPYYVSDRIYSFLGCTEQYQWCNATTYSNLGGLLINNTLPYYGIEFNNVQKTVFNLLWEVVSEVYISAGTLYLSDQLLLAQNHCWNALGRISAPLDQTHWIAEVENFVNLMLSAIQGLVVEYIDPNDLKLDLPNGTFSSLSVLQPPDTDDGKRICNMIRIRDAAYFNFSVVGIAVLVGLGITVTLIDLLCIPGAAFWLRRKLKLSMHPQHEWIEGQNWRLQRIAFESHGIGPWIVSEQDNIPVTEKRGLLFPAERAWSREIQDLERD
jgi:hypothetical protein